VYFSMKEISVLKSRNMTTLKRSLSSYHHIGVFIYVCVCVNVFVYVYVYICVYVCVYLRSGEVASRGSFIIRN